MQIATNDIVDKTLEHEGNYVNQDLYIAEANFKIGRPRIIQPVRAKLVSKEEAPKNKTIYYSYNFFKVYKPNGKLDSKVVAVFDNTGFRSYRGNPISIFDNYDEAVVWFNKEIQKVIDERNKAREVLLKNHDDETQKLIDKLVK